MANKAIRKKDQDWFRESCKDVDKAYDVVTKVAKSIAKEFQKTGKNSK